MIVSHKHRFIFIKTSKTAGTSLEIFLGRHCGTEDLITPITPAVAGHVPRNDSGYYNHMPAAEVRTKIGLDLWKRYFTFCVERNPWDKALSHWHMENFRSDGSLTLDQYLQAGHFPLNYPKYTEPGRPYRILVDEVVFYEDLNHSLSRIMARLGIPFSGVLEPRAKSEYRTDRRHYREVLTINQANLIRAAFTPEISLHGYTY